MVDDEAGGVTDGAEDEEPISNIEDDDVEGVELYVLVFIII